MPPLDGKVAIVTGAGRGIGRAHALALAGAGANVLVNDVGASASGEGHDPGPAQSVADEITAHGGKATPNSDDVSDFQHAENMVKQAIGDFGRLDILVNNAGILRDRMLVNMAEQEWDPVISVHLKGHFAPTRHAAAYWREMSKSGRRINARVINTSSPSGVFGNVGQSNYGAAKAGIAAFTVIAAQELRPYGVTVNCLAPNARTRMTEQTFGSMPQSTTGFDALEAGNISPLVVALASDDAQGITGQCFFVYGGVISVLKPWDVGQILKKDERWEAGELVAKLREIFPDGIAPEGMGPAMMRAAGGEGIALG
ncbi:MAG TPA: SDR family oxidoreductase [Actinomycetota bacterium]|jgi:NAD(P)-dependent dehydrogenase (short-subunit alcohol dehydrogenase family)|nr:SDR family oxidoreductase [Actinomycetota bacterium]